MWAMVLKEFRQLRRDRRTVALLIFQPLLLLVVFGYAASFDVESVRTVVVGPAAEQAAPRLPGVLDVVDTDTSATRADAVDELKRGKAVVAVVAQERPEVLVDGSELFAARAVVSALGQARAATARSPGRVPFDEIPEPEVLFNPGLDTPTIMIPAIIGMILVFVGTIATSLGVVRERQAGTLEQLAVMPFKPRDVFTGKLAPYFLVASIDMLVIVGTGMLLFDIPFNGSALVFILGALLFLLVALGMGVLISTVSQNQGQAIQLAMLTLLPQILLSGMVFPLNAMAAGVRWISYFLPLTYFTQIARGVMVRGAPFDALLLPLGLLAVLGIAVFGLASMRFRRDLAPAGGAR